MQGLNCAYITGTLHLYPELTLHHESKRSCSCWEKWTCFLLKQAARFMCSCKDTIYGVVLLESGMVLNMNYHQYFTYCEHLHPKKNNHACLLASICSHSYPTGWSLRLLAPFVFQFKCCTVIAVTNPVVVWPSNFCQKPVRLCQNYV